MIFGLPLNKKDLLNICLIYGVARLVIVLSILFIPLGPFAAIEKNPSSFRWVDQYSAFHLKSGSQKIYLTASSPVAQVVDVLVNGEKKSSLVLGSKKERHILSIATEKDQKSTVVSFQAAHAFVPNLGNSASLDQRILSWQLYYFSNDDGQNALNQMTPIIGFYDVEGNRKADLIVEKLVVWDGRWYADIVEKNYQYNGDVTIQQNIAFYPAYPAVAFLFSQLLGINAQQALLTVNNLAVFLAMVVIFVLGRRAGLSSDRALLAIALFSFNPFSIFLAAAYSEGLFIFLVAVTIWLLQNNKYWWAAVVGGLITATRAPGLIFPLVFLVHFFH